MSAGEILDNVVERIRSRFDPDCIVLFGSRARGDARADSDVDLLVVLPHVEDARKAAVEIRRVLSDLPVSKDVIVSTRDEMARRGDMIGSILRPAIREGKVLYERG